MSVLWRVFKCRGDVFVCMCAADTTARPHQKCCQNSPNEIVRDSLKLHCAQNTQRLIQVMFSHESCVWWWKHALIWIAVHVKLHRRHQGVYIQYIFLWSVWLHTIENTSWTNWGKDLTIASKCALSLNKNVAKHSIRTHTFMMNLVDSLLSVPILFTPEWLQPHLSVDVPRFCHERIWRVSDENILYVIHTAHNTQHRHCWLVVRTTKHSIWVYLCVHNNAVRQLRQANLPL